MQYSMRSMKISIKCSHLYCKSNLTEMSRDTRSSVVTNSNNPNLLTRYFYSLIDHITYNRTHFLQFKVVVQVKFIISNPPSPSPLRFDRCLSLAALSRLRFHISETVELGSGLVETSKNAASVAHHWISKQ